MDPQNESLVFTRRDALEQLLDPTARAGGVYFSVAHVRKEGEEQVAKCLAAEVGDPIAWLVAVLLPLLATVQKLKARVRAFEPGGVKLGDLTTTVTRSVSEDGARMTGGSLARNTMQASTSSLVPRATASFPIRGDPPGRDRGAGLTQESDGIPGDRAEIPSRDALDHQFRGELEHLADAVEAERARRRQLERTNERLEERYERLTDRKDRIVESRDNLRDRLAERTGERDEARLALGMAMAEVRRLRSERDRARAAEARALEQKEAERARRYEAEEEREDAGRTVEEIVATEAEIWGDNSLSGRLVRFFGSPLDED